MRVLFFLIYLAIGGGAAYGAHAYGGYELTLSAIGGAFFALLLGQVHLFAAGGRDKGLESKLFDLDHAQENTSRRVNVLEARTDAVETSLKHELTERRDALVTEMKQLEGLISRLSDSFESRNLNGSASPLRSGQPASASMPPPADDRILRDVKDALEHSRIDLHLQPIVSLPQRRVAFYEGLTRLRRAEGSLILPSEFLDAARRAHLLGMIDSLTLFRCVQIVRRLTERDRRVGVFCNISAASLEDERFFPFFLEFISEHRNLAGSVIFELRADRFVQRSRAMRENMDKLAGMGFRFSLDHAASPELDLPRLQDAGVKFVKFDGPSLIGQLRNPDGPRPTSNIMAQVRGEDVSAIYSRYGVTMIAEKLEDEASVVEVLEFEIPYGQGHVFGSPRPIKATLMEETQPPPTFRERLSSFG